MKPVLVLIILLVGLAGCLAPPARAETPPRDFAAWLAAFRAEAVQAGISRQTLDQALSGVREPLPRVIEKDRAQPEFTQPVEKYIADRANRKRIEKGRRMLERYPTWLGRVEREYGVQRRFIVALWGIESNYGENMGGFPVIQSLVTLAWDPRRGKIFRRELLAALRILEEERMDPQDLTGSWAGALGQCQFMPTSFRAFAVNADGGKTDIWTSLPDVFASTANYLARAGWKDDQTWGRPVRIPEGFDPALAGLEQRLTLPRWQQLGVRRADGRDLPRRPLSASLILPEGPGGPAWLVYDNFRALLAWNRSVAFALAVGTLADQLDAK